MTFIDLKKRRQARQEAQAQAAPAPVVAAPPEPEQPPTPAPPLQWEPGLLTALADAVPRQREVLLAGLGPWGHGGTRGLPEVLLGKARAVVALDPDKGRLSVARGYCQRILEGDPADVELPKRLATQRYGLVLVSDRLLTTDDPVAFLRALKTWLAPEGELLLVVPNAAHAGRRLALLAGDAPREFEPGGQRQHFTRARLREALAFAGLAAVAWRSYDQPVEAPGLAPELFPPAVLEALGPQDDARAGFFIVRAAPRPADYLLRELFDEAEALKRAVRNELAVAAARHDEMDKATRASQFEQERLGAELEEAKRRVATLEDANARAEQNIRRLGKEADDAQRELGALKGTFWHKLGQWLRREPAAPVEASSGPEPWKWDPEPKNRYSG